MTQTTHISQQFFSSQEVAEIVGAMSNLFIEKFVIMEQKLAKMELMIMENNAQDTQAFSQVNDLHRITFTPIEKLVAKEDSSASLRTKILSRPPRPIIRK